jgi:hypothetical protein
VGLDALHIPTHPQGENNMNDRFDPKFGSVVALGPFSVSNLTAGQSNTDLTLAGTSTTTPMLKAGSVLGVGLNASADVTAGSVIARAHKASTEFAQSGYPAATLDTTNVRASYGTCRPGLIRFAAGDKLGISVTTDATWAPTNTNDLDAFLYVVLDPD